MHSVARKPDLAPYRPQGRNDAIIDLTRPLLRKRIEHFVRGAVVSLPGITGVRDQGREQHHELRRSLQEGVAHVVGRERLGVEHAPERVETLVGDQRILHDTGRVDHNVDATEGLPQRLHGLCE